jgi:glycyl-tRNA synthetase (class II)
MVASRHHMIMVHWVYNSSATSQIDGGKTLYFIGTPSIILLSLIHIWMNGLMYLAVNRKDCVGIDSSIIIHPKVWETAGITVILPYHCTLN